MSPDPRKSSQQVFTTTHSPVVLRELSVAEHELYVCKRNGDGTVAVESVANVAGIQRRVRSNAEAFLGRRIIACEGATEIGLLRAYDIFRLDADNPAVWSLATAYFDCRGASEIESVCAQLISLGYDLAALCDNDAPMHLSDEDVRRLRAAGVHVCQWEQGQSTETQLFAELPWPHLPNMLTAIAERHDTLEYSTIIDNIRTVAQARGLQLGTDPSSWPDEPALRASLNEDAVRTAAYEIARQGIEAVAVCLLHSYANPSHEARVRDILLERLPNALISLSSEVLPVFREFERSMVTILNAYVMAPVARYVGRLDSRLDDAGVATPLLLMNSSGGVVGSSTARRKPVQTALSGPAAGVLGAASIGIAAGHPDLITIDIGGTSADVCLIKDGRPTITKRGRIGDWPVHTPMVDMETIGAGGGSIARVSGGGSLAVGPDSAGAEPGPACYGRGGTLPTVTDAHLALGRLCDSLLDDSLGLDREAANEAIRRSVADPLDMTIERAAEGILEVVNNAMVGAIRLVSVERGFNPRDFALLGFGGAGPLHATALARLLGMSTVIVPPSPGVLSAFGLTVADIRNDFSRTCLERPPHYDLTRIEGVFRDLNAQAMAWLEAEGIPKAARPVEWEASFRYRNQGFELTVPWNGTDVSEASLESAFAAFHRVHEQLYTFCQPDTPVEVVTLHVTAIGRLSRPVSATAVAPAGGRSIIGSQKLYYGGTWVDCPIHARDRLAPDAMIPGPAIIKQHDTTTVLEPGQTATVHRSGSLIVRLH